MGGRARRPLNIRLILVGAGLVLTWVGVGYRLFYIQGVAADEYAALGLQQRLHHEVLAADRGTIFDRDGHELAVSVGTLTIYANPNQIVDPWQTALQIGPHVGLDPMTLEARLSKDVGFVYVARQLDRRDAEEVRALALPGIYFTEEPKRTYPSGALAAQVIGFVQTDTNQGLEGLEMEYDTVLAGKAGELLVERDQDGRVIPLGEYEAVPATPGDDLVTTIDRDVQFEAERVLGATVERYGAAAGTMVVLDPLSGEVLAMANVPGFDPNDRRESDPAVFRNRAVTDVYEPGSTQKLMTVAGAIEDGIVSPGDVFHIPAQLQVGNVTFSDDVEVDRSMTVADIVAYSSNVGTVLIEQKLGNAAFYRYLSAFGLGRASEVGFPGEATGVLPPLSEWCAEPCGPSKAIGYGVSVTALQMASAFGVVANDGVWVQPRLVKEVVAGDGSVSKPTYIQLPVISPQTAGLMRGMLEKVVEKGTGTRAQVPGYRVGGKTGTTRKYLEEEGRYGEDVIASFIGIAPIDAPRIVIAVMIDSPAGGEFGGEVAAPAFAEVALSTLNQLGVPPSDG